MNKRKKASYGMEKKKRGGEYMEPNKELKFGGPSRKRAQMGEKGFTQPIKPKKSEAVKDDKLSAQLAAESAKVAITPSGPKKVEQKKSSGGGSYAQAKKNNPNLDKLISQRKGLKKGTPEYNAVQNKINKAYGKGPTNRPTAKPAEKPKAAPAPMKTTVKPVDRSIKMGKDRVPVKPENLSKAMAEQGLKQAGERLQKSKVDTSPTTPSRRGAKPSKENKIKARAEKKIGNIQDRRAKAAGRKEERQVRKEDRMDKRSSIKEARGTKRAAIREARGKQPRKKALIGMGLGKIASAAGNLIGGKFGDTLSNVGNIAQNPLGAAKNAIQGNPLGEGLDQQTPPGQSGAAGVIGQVANALGGNQQQQPQQQTMKKGGKKRKMMGGKKMKYKTGGAKPDYLDMDKDGNKTESMKSALKDRRSKARYGKKK